MSCLKGGTGTDHGHSELFGNNEGIFNRGGIFMKCPKGGLKDAQFCLCFYGDITAENKEGCLPVCEAFGKQWFVSMPNKTKTCLLPSWYVQSEVAAVKQKLTANCKVNCKMFRFTYSFDVVGWQPEIMQVGVMLFYITASLEDMQAASQGNKAVQLIRPIIDDTTKAPAKQPKVSRHNKNLRAKDSKDVSSDPIFAQRKHLFK